MNNPKRPKFSEKPDLHIVLGSGLGNRTHLANAFKDYDLVEEFSFTELHLTPPTAPQHGGQIGLMKHRDGSHCITLQWGRLHLYEGLAELDVIAPVELLRSLGTQNFILTNAAGSMIPGSTPGDLMLINDHINFTGANPLGAERLPFGVEGRFHSMSRVYGLEDSFEYLDRAKQADGKIKSWKESFHRSFSSYGLKCYEGIYLGLRGPTFETPAEIRAYQALGADAVGMSTVLEAIYLKSTGANVIGISMLSNMACGFVGKKDCGPEDVSRPALDLSVQEVFDTAEVVSRQFALGLAHFISEEKRLYEISSR